MLNVEIWLRASCFFNYWYCVSVYMFRKRAKGNPENECCVTGIYNDGFAGELFNLNRYQISIQPLQFYSQAFL